MKRMNVHFVLAFVLRLVLVGCGYVQDALFEVKYTDVDYQVFTDAAQYMSEGLSPFRRHTYRYTPALALLVVPNVLLHPAFGKVLFCLLDVLTSVLVHRIQRNLGFGPELCRTSALLWLYNPLPIVISTRGNAESILTFLTTLAVLLCQVGRPATLGLVYGLSVHFKIYPCIYALSFYFAADAPAEGTRGWERWRPSRARAAFVSCSAVGFLVPTLASLALCGEEYLQEALLYHVTRKDVRHNFSPYFYLLYLMEAQSTNGQLANLVSAFAFLLQAVLVATTSLTFTQPRALPACMFVQTSLFVTFNKVCTSQYFAWYLCLFPLTYPLLKDRLKVAAAFLVWLGAQGLWLLPAYLFEFQGNNTFLPIFVASLVFFLVNVYLVCSFVKCVHNSLHVCTVKKSK